MTEAQDYARSTLPEGRSGDWVIDRYEIAAAVADDSRPHWAVSKAGMYTRLRHNDTVFMTDQREEWYTQLPAIEAARAQGGEVLLTGLGLGLVAEAMLGGDSGVQRVVVIERSPEVIALAGPHLARRYGHRLEVIQADAFTWNPPAGARFSVGWHDIWPNPAAPECPAEEDALITRYAPFCEWQGTWSAHWRAVEATARRRV